MNVNSTSPQKCHQCNYKTQYDNLAEFQQLKVDLKQALVAALHLWEVENHVKLIFQTISSRPSFGEVECANTAEIH